MLNNDWIVANLNNPGMTDEMFKMKGLDTDNTQFLSKDQYLKSNYILNNKAFQNDQGVFSQDKFDDYYKEQATKWKNFQKNKNEAVMYDMFDMYSDLPGNTTLNPLTGDGTGMKPSKKNPFGSMIQVSRNPLNQAIGYQGFSEISDQTESTREIAQGQKIFDTASGTFTNESVNDKALFSNPVKFFRSLFQDNLVLATWDDEGYHTDPLTGEQIYHAKGEAKLNSDDKPYYETLNGRTIRGKQVLSMGDYITREDSPIRKYDFMASDVMDKDWKGSLVKNVASVIPIAIPGMAGYYSGFLVARELAKVAPMILNYSSVFTNEHIDSPFFNMLAGKATALSSSTSDYAQKEMFASENILNMMGDVANQWGQQQSVASWTKKLLGDKGDYTKLIEEEAKALYDKKLTSLLEGENAMANIMRYGYEEKAAADAIAKHEIKDLAVGEAWKATTIGRAAIEKVTKQYTPQIERLNKLGAKASLAYMALVSNGDTYDTALEYGLTPRESALLALGATAGMYWVDQKGIGELFFDELAKKDIKQIQGALHNERAKWIKDFAEQIGVQTKSDTELTGNVVSRLIKKGRNATSEMLEKYADDIAYHTTGFFGKALGEGLEEVAEEFTTDSAKLVYEIFGKLGIASQKDVGAFGYDKDLNDGEGGYDIEKLLKRYGLSMLGGTLGGGLFYGVEVVKGKNFHINTKDADMLMLVRNDKAQDMIDEVEKQRKRGEYGSTTISASEFVKDSLGDQVGITVNGEMSVNDYIANKLINQIRAYQTILNDNNLSKNDDELFDQLIMRDKVLGALSASFKDESYVTGYQEQWQALATDIVTAQKGLEIAAQCKNGEIPDAVLKQLNSNKSSKDLIEELGEARLPDMEKRHNPEEEAKRNLMVSSWQKYLMKKKKALQEFESPESSSYYTEMLMFKIDPMLSSIFGTFNFESWLYQNYHGLETQDLTENELNHYKAEYENYRNSKQKLDLAKSFENYKDFQKRINPKLQQMADSAKNYDKIQEQLEELFGEDDFWLLRTSDPSQQQWYETDAEYKASQQQEGESDDDFNKRFQARTDEINDKVEERLEEIQTFLQNNSVDILTNRRVRNILLTRLKDVHKQVAQFVFTGIPELQGLFSQFLQDYKGGDIDKVSEYFKLIGLPDENYTYETVLVLLTNLQRLCSMYTEKTEWDDDEGEDVTTYTFYNGFKISQPGLGTFANDFLNYYLNLKADENYLPNDGASTQEKIKNLFGSMQTFDRTEQYHGTDSGYKNQTYYDILSTVFSEEEADRFYSSVDTSEAGDGKITLNPFVFFKEDIENFANATDLDTKKAALSTLLNKLSDNTSKQLMSHVVRNLSEYESDLQDIYKVLLKMRDVYTKALDSKIAEFKQIVQNDKIASILTELEQKTNLINPIVELAKTLPIFNSDMESVFNSLYKAYEDEENLSDFILDGPQMSNIQEIQTTLQLLLGYINAASINPTIDNYFGHNKTINRFNREHGIKAEELAEIDENYASIYETEIANYLRLIDPSQCNLVYLSNVNQGNIIAQFDKTDEVLEKTKVDFWEQNKSSFESCQVQTV